MTLIRTVHIRCDGCGADAGWIEQRGGQQPPAGIAARLEVRESGWTRRTPRTSEALDLCPRCSS